MDSINIPSKKGIRLPFKPSYRPKNAPSPRSCGICRKAPSAYTCPACNIPYCSIECFQDTARHSQCSEPFFKREVEGNIRSVRGRTPGEKNKMFELLQMFEEGVGKEEPLTFDDDDREGDDDNDDNGLDALERALGEVDIDTLDPETLLQMLPPLLRDQFLASLAAPEESALLQELFRSEELQQELQEPWWISEEAIMDKDEDGAGADVRAIPDVIALPPGLSPTPDASEKLLYNIEAIILAYVQTTLTLRVSPLANSLSSTSPLSSSSTAPLPAILLLVPMLEDPKSTVLLTSHSQAVLYVSSRSGNPSFPARFITPLLRPPLDLTEPHPLQRVLSDMHRLLLSEDSKPHRRAAKKVEFFCACVGGISRARWLALVGEVERAWAKEEKLDQGQDDDNDGEDADVDWRTAGTLRSGPVIEEVGGRKEGSSKHARIEELAENGEEGQAVGDVLKNLSNVGGLRSKREMGRIIEIG